MEELGKALEQGKVRNVSTCGLDGSFSKVSQLHGSVRLYLTMAVSDWPRWVGWGCAPLVRSVRSPLRELGLQGTGRRWHGCPL